MNVNACCQHSARVAPRGVRQLELLPAHRLAVTCEGQNGEVIQPSNGSGGYDHAVLIVNPKGPGVDAFPVADDLGRIRIVGTPLPKNSV